MQEQKKRTGNTSKQEERLTKDQRKALARSAAYLDICWLEDAMVQNRIGLTSAMVISESLGIAPFLHTEAMNSAMEARELLDEFHRLHAKLETALDLVEWKGSSLPSDDKLWPYWWTAVRKHASQFRLGKNKGNYRGYILKHQI